MAKKRKLRIASYNINGINSRFHVLERWLEEFAPDIVGLQELKCTDEAFPADAIEALGYSAVWHGQKSWNGVALVAREPAEPVQVGLPGQEALGARLLAARVGELTVASVYVPNGKSVGHEDFERKLVWLDALADWVAPRRDEPLVLGGDFNLCPTGLDSWNEERFRGHIFHTDAERGRFAKLQSLGLVDLFRARHPERQAFSWWDYRAGSFHRGQGLRIDFLLATPHIATRLREAEIDRDWRKKHDDLAPSDHAPVWVDLDGAA
jgi:exodeoxyribonuclease-3